MSGEGGSMRESTPQNAPAPAPSGARRSRTVVEGSMWGAGVLLVVALVGMVNYFGLKYYKRWDWTGTKLYSLSDKTLSVLKGLDKNVDAVMLLQPGAPTYDPAKELLERYASASRHFSFRTVDAQRNIAEAKQLVDRFKLNSLDVIVFEAGNDRRLVQSHDLADFDYSGMQYGAKPTMTAFKGEEAFTGAILALVEKEKPKVLFTKGHGELSLDDVEQTGMSQIRDLLGQENMDLDSWASLGQKDVPAGTDLLVVAGPKSSFLPPELETFGRYLDQGGRMLVLLDPELDQKGGVVETGLEPWLAQHGVTVDDDLVVDPSATVPFYGDETLFVRGSGTNPVVASLEQAQIPAIVSLARSVRPGSVPAALEATPLVETSSDGWGETDLAHLHSVAKDAKDVTGPVPVGVAVAARDQTKSPEQLGEEEEENPEAAAEAAAAKPDPNAPKWRLVVYGDSDFASNALLGAAGNSNLVANTFNWLLERKNLLGIGPKKPEQVRLALTPGQLHAVTWGTLAGMPGLAILAGVAVWWRRRQRV